MTNIVCYHVNPSDACTVVERLRLVVGEIRTCWEEMEMCTAERLMTNSSMCHVLELISTKQGLTSAEVLAFFAKQAPEGTPPV